VAMADNRPEVWLRGPVDGYAPELQPVVHSLLQAIEDVEAETATLTPAQIWTTPGGGDADAGADLDDAGRRRVGGVSRQTPGWRARSPLHLRERPGAHRGTEGG